MEPPRFGDPPRQTTGQGHLPRRMGQQDEAAIIRAIIGRALSGKLGTSHPRLSTIIGPYEAAGSHPASEGQPNRPARIRRPPEPRHKPPAHPASSSHPGEWMPEPSGSTPNDRSPAGRAVPLPGCLPVAAPLACLSPHRAASRAHRHEPSARPRRDDAPNGDGGQAARQPRVPSCLAVSSGPATSLAQSLSRAAEDASHHRTARGLRFAPAAYSSGFHLRQLSGHFGISTKRDCSAIVTMSDLRSTSSPKSEWSVSLVDGLRITIGTEKPST